MKKHFSRFNNLLLAVGIAVAMASRADASHLTFSNTAPITINDNASATPYPSTIPLGSLGILDVNVTVTGLLMGFRKTLASFWWDQAGKKSS